MRYRGIVFAGLLFAGGIGVGFWLGSASPRTTLTVAPQGEGKGARPASWEEIRGAVQALRGLWSSSGDPVGRRSHAAGGGSDFGDGGDRPIRRTRDESLAAFREALAAGDSWEARRALRDLERLGGPLTPEQLQELSASLGSADRELLRDISRTLAIAGGKEGLLLVIGFLEDPEQPLERRRQALDGLCELPEDRAAEAIPALAEFLEKGPPLDLERSAARVVGQLGREKGVETLLGLLGSHPGIRAEAIFDALGDVGGPGDSKGVLALLGGDWPPGAKMSLLRTAARLAGQGGESSELLKLLREPPAGVSREMVARALGDASRDLGSGLLRDALRETAGDHRAQEAIARALLWSGGKESLDILLEAARSPEVALDARVLARALNDFQGQAAVPLMLDLFRSSRDEEVLGPLARGIARNADRESMESLLGLIESGGDAWQRRALARALEDGSSAALGADRLLSLLRAEKDQEVASSLARALSRLHPTAIEGRAGELFQGAASAVERVAFAQMLERSEVPGMAEILGRQLRAESDSRAQWEMARILGRIGEEGLEEITASLRYGADEGYRHSLLWGLEASRRPVAPEARSLFVAAASGDPSVSIRAQAAEILGRQQDPALIPVLSGLLETEQDRFVRERIERAIRELEGRR
jgi:HEAT repeat protein